MSGPVSPAQPGTGSVVLLVAVELCSVAFRLDTLTKESIVASALFADGAAACVLRSGGGIGGLAQVEASGQHTWPGTLDIMGWSVDDTGLGVIFDRAIPPFATQNMGPAVTGILQRAGIAMGQVDRFACHPGGAKVITALEVALSLDQGTLDHERAVLADHGNMSAPTALFVLDRLAHAPPHRPDRHEPGLHSQQCLADPSCMTPAAILLTLVTLERLTELWQAKKTAAPAHAFLPEPRRCDCVQ